MEDLFKKLFMDELVFGKSIYKSIDQNYEVISPLSDEAKEIMFKCSIQHLTRREIIEKYGDTLTEEELKQLKSLRD